MKSKGQVATEFFMYTTVFMFVVVAAFIVVNMVQSTEIPLKENTIAKETGEFFASSITLAVKGGKGFTYNYTFPTTILGKPYRLSFSDQTKTMILDWDGRYGKFSQSYALPSYDYEFPSAGSCIDGKGSLVTGDLFYEFNSNSSGCSNILTLKNDGEKLTVIHND